MRRSDEPIAKATFVSEGLFYFISNGFFLVSEDSSEPKWETQSRLEWMNRLPAFARCLRSESKQASFIPKLVSFGPVSLTCPRSVELPQVGDPCATASWHLRTAIRSEHILRAGRQPLSEPPPSYDTLLLDAIDCLSHEDYPTAFLLASISMDHLARMQAAIAFAASIAGECDRSLAIDFPSGKRDERKKVLFEMLIDDRRSFKDFLHRVPLVLMGRSLLQDDKDLYDTANRVYQTRNRVVHKELIFGDDSPRFSGCDEALEAIGCAVRLAHWFGVMGHYAHPFDGFPGTICHSARQ